MLIRLTVYDTCSPAIDKIYQAAAGKFIQLRNAGLTVTIGSTLYPSPYGCWIPHNSPYWATANCNVTWLAVPAA
jgi:hypothetical protein